MPQLKDFSFGYKETLAWLNALLNQCIEGHFYGNTLVVSNGFSNHMDLYFLHVYKFKDVQPAIFVFKYLRATFFSWFLMWVFLPRYPKSTHIFGENSQQGTDPNVVINVKNIT